MVAGLTDPIWSIDEWVTYPMRHTIKKNILYSAFDTAILSALNFSLGILLINFSSKHEYGVYTLLFTGLMLAVGFQNAFITTQLTVKGAKKNTIDKKKFAESLFGLQIVMSAVLIVSMLLVVSVYSGLFGGTINFPVIIVFLVITVLGTYGREYLRSHQYLYYNARGVFIIDLTFVLMVSIFMLAYHYFSGHITALLVLAVIGSASIVVTILFSLKLHIRPSFTANNLKSSFYEVLPNGRWAIGGICLSWMQGNTYAYLVSIMLNPSVTAELAAGRLLLMPINLLSEAMYRIFKPKWASIVDKEFKAVYSSVLKVTVFILVTLLIYFLSLWYFWDVVISKLFNEEYLNIFNIVLLWCGVFLVQTVRSQYSQLLQVLEEFEYLTKLNIPAAFVAIISSALLTLVLGASGALVGVILGELLLVVLLNKRIKYVQN